jgi:hypothetical protein
MSLITSVEHAYAIAIGDLKKTSQFIQSRVLPAMDAAHAAAPTVEAVSATACPQLANIERVGDAALGVLIKAVKDAQAAGHAGGVNVQLDASLVGDLKAIIPTVESQAALLLKAAPATAVKAA